MKIIKTILLISSIILVTRSASSQSIPFALDSMLSKSLDSMQILLNVKSLSAAIQFTDSTNWKRATGISSLVPLDSVSTDDVYLIGSVTKTITAACILQLADQGFLSLDDSLHQWLDTITFIDPDITIRQLLRHQSGIYDVLNNPACQPALLADQDSIWDAEDLIATFIQPPVFQPGVVWSYSNTNYFLLGMIIKEITGNPFYQELRNRFFMSVAMNTIAIPAFETLAAPVAHVWMDLNNDGITEDAHNFYMNYLSLNSVAGAAGGYFATPSEISKWMRTYMRGDLISAALMTEAKTTVTAPGLPSATYGLGLTRKYFAGFEGFGHGGDLAYAASSWYFPAKDISITVFTNDSKNNSWTLVPVVSALLKSYNDYFSTISSENIPEDIVLDFVSYPNPFYDRISVKINLKQSVAGATLILTNVLGEQIASIEISNTSAVNIINFDNVSELSSGMYFVHLIIDGKPINSLKVIK